MWDVASYDEDVYQAWILDKGTYTIYGKALLGKSLTGKSEEKLTVQVNAYSESAKQKIEAAGGKAEVI